MHKPIKMEKDRPPVLTEVSKLCVHGNLEARRKPQIVFGLGLALPPWVA
jgi:hypothetical protein